jgi:hypothetical protein
VIQDLAVEKFDSAKSKPKSPLQDSFQQGELKAGSFVKRNKVLANLQRGPVLITAPHGQKLLRVTNDGVETRLPELWTTELALKLSSLVDLGSN